MAVDVTSALSDLLSGIMGNKEEALKYLEDPDAAMAEAGLSDVDLGNVNVAEVTGDVATNLGIQGPASEALTSYTNAYTGDANADRITTGGTVGSSGGSGGSGGGATSYAPPAAAPTTVGAAPVYAPPPPATPPPGMTPYEAVQEHITYVTNVTYIDDSEVTNVINEITEETNIDNSVNLDINADGDIDGDIDIDVTNVNATGDGSVAAGEDVENAVTGDNSTLIDGDVTDSAVISGDNAGVVAVNSDVSETVIGDGNQVVSGDGNQVAFGDGDISDDDIQINAVDSTVNVAGGDVTNVQDVDVSDGSAIAVGGDAAGGTNIEIEDSDGVGVLGGVGTSTDIEDSFNDQSNTEFTDSFNDQSFVDNAVDIEDAFNDNSVDQTQVVVEEVVVEAAPADMGDDMGGE